MRWALRDGVSGSDKCRNMQGVRGAKQFQPARLDQKHIRQGLIVPLEKIDPLLSFDTMSVIDATAAD
jgi:hypothetical protein